MNNPLNQMLRDNPEYSGFFDNPLFFVFIAWTIIIAGVLIFMKKKIKGPEKKENDQ